MLKSASALTAFPPEDVPLKVYVIESAYEREAEKSKRARADADNVAPKDLAKSLITKAFLG